jgi:PleD family two-component response regulator
MDKINQDTLLEILIVDDDISVVQLLNAYLVKNYRCKVSTAMNGLDALLRLRESKVDLIFLDLAMPEINGMEALDAIRNDSELRDIPVVIMSSISKKEVVQQALKYGIFDYIRKPIIIHEAALRLDQVIKSILNSQSKEHSEKVLIIDNDKTFKNELAKLLSQRYRVLTAEDGAEGYKIFTIDSPKIIILGENIKILNEKYLAKKIKNHQNGKEVKIIMTRTKDDLTIDERGYVDLFVEKNFVAEIFEENFEKPKNPFSSFKEFSEEEKSESEKLAAYTKILGLVTVTDYQQIAKVFRELIAKYHPDKVTHLGEEFQQFAMIKSRELNRAHEYFKKKFGV